MNNKEILQKAKELVELLEKQEETEKIELSRQNNPCKRIKAYY